MEKDDIKAGVAYVTKTLKCNYYFIFKGDIGTSAWPRQYDVAALVDVCIEDTKYTIYKETILNIVASETRECTTEESAYLLHHKNGFYGYGISFEEFLKLEANKLNDPDLGDIYKMIDESSKQI